jgi:hypothetical protein
MAEVVEVEINDSFTHVAVRGKLDAAGVGAVEPGLTARTVPPHSCPARGIDRLGFVLDSVVMTDSLAQSAHAERWNCRAHGNPPLMERRVSLLQPP